MLPSGPRGRAGKGRSERLRRRSRFQSRISVETPSRYHGPLHNLHRQGVSSRQAPEIFRRVRPSSNCFGVLDIDKTLLGLAGISSLVYGTNKLTEGVKGQPGSKS